MVATYNIQSGGDGEGRVGGGLTEVLPAVLQLHPGDGQLPALNSHNQLSSQSILLTHVVHFLVADDEPVVVDVGVVPDREELERALPPLPPPRPGDLRSENYFQILSVMVTLRGEQAAWRFLIGFSFELVNEGTGGSSRQFPFVR